MKKKIFIGIGVFLVLIVGTMAFLNNRNRTLSPPGNSELTTGDFTMTVDYSRPSVKGRVIFGTEEEGALQPYGAYWRLGANEATEISINKDVQVLNANLTAGRYTVYAVPGKESFEIFFNKDLGNWGAWEPDHSRDVASVEIPVNTGEHVEQFTIDFKQHEGVTLMICEFGETQLLIPFLPKG